MRIAITTDDLSLDLNTALEIGHEQNCKEFELRRLGLDPVGAGDERWLELAEKAVQSKRLRVTALSPGFFKDEVCPFGRYTVEHNMLFERVFAAAKRLHCHAISITAFQRGDDDEPTTPDADADDGDEDELEFNFPDHIVEALRQFALEAQGRELEVWLRSAPDTWAAGTIETLALIKLINLPNVGFDWDIAATMSSADSTGLDHIEDVLPMLKAVHVSDAVRRGLGAENVSVGKGVIPWEDLIEQLYEDGYRGPLILSPNVAPKLRETRAGLTLLNRWLEAARSKAQTAKRKGRKGELEDEE